MVLTKFLYFIRIIVDAWQAGVKVEPINANDDFGLTVVYYLADEHSDSSMFLNANKSEPTIVIDGFNERNGDYTLNINGSSTAPQVFATKAPSEHVWDASKLLLDLIQTRGGAEQHERDMKMSYNFAASSYTSNEPFELSVSYRRGKPEALQAITQLTKRSLAFKRRFQRTFKNIPRDARSACRFALSNLLGSISYFYGTSYVLQENIIAKEVIETEPFELFTDIPSRATFPRGFLWDSGFHSLILSEWSPKLALEVLQSWANRVEHNGWVAREQVPGSEARRAVPVEYIIQNTKHANPPVVLMSLLKLARRVHQTGNLKEKEMIVHQLHHIAPHFQRNLKWLIRTQRGQVHPQFCKLMQGHRTCPRVLKLPAFRWRGRSKYHNLNSGLDDYPRGDFANRFELHVDLACWVAFGAQGMLEMYGLLGVKCEEKMRHKFKMIYRRVRFSLDHLHWDAERKIYSDLTISDQGKMMYVQHQGYVNLFPLLFGFIEKDSPRLKATLDLIEDRTRLWTDFGLRSLSHSDPYYMNGDQYWTGPIWINMNYLVLSALFNHYMDPSGENYKQVKSIYTRLRENIVSNMSKSYKETGTIWEQYSDVDGRGMRSRPFTGWSALLILIAAEHY